MDSERLQRTPILLARIEKVKTSAELRGRAKHNLRFNSPINANPDAPINVHLGSPDPEPLLAEFKRFWPSDRRKDAVLALEVVLSVFGGDIAGHEDEFVTRCVDFVRREYGRNLLSVVAHFDETSPHVHSLIIPLVNNRLNAKAIMGNCTNMQQFQSRAHAAVAELGIARGIEGSRASHIRLSQFYAGINSPAVLTLPAHPTLPDISGDWSDEGALRIIKAQMADFKTAFERWQTDQQGAAERLVEQAKTNHAILLEKENHRTNALRLRSQLKEARQKIQERDESERYIRAYAQVALSYMADHPDMQAYMQVGMKAYWDKCGVSDTPDIGPFEAHH